MSDYCVVVADGVRARLFSLDEAAIGAGGPNLVEIADLINPDLAAEALRGDEKSGHNVASASSGSHGFEDHRDSHRRESERRFAKQVAAEAATAVKHERAGCLVVVAESRMLSQLRDALNLPVTVLVSEVAKDLTELAPQELHARLAAVDALPGRQIPA